METIQCNLPAEEPVLSFTIPDREDPLLLGLWEIESQLEKSHAAFGGDDCDWVPLVRTQLNEKYGVTLSLGQTAAFIEIVGVEWDKYKKKADPIAASPSGTESTLSECTPDNEHYY